MIFASIGGTAAVGFAEAVAADDGRIERRGIVKLASAPSTEMLAQLDRGAALVYSGPVWANGRWRIDTFPVLAAEPPELSDGSMTLRFIEWRSTTIASSA